MLRKIDLGGRLMVRSIIVDDETAFILMSAKIYRDS